ncbi:MAG: DNA polymerase II, partial [Gammaproteobacteria bacterium]|nr:DNA polymerase II [Gammaproteobacteria bacterium]
MISQTGFVLTQQAIDYNFKPLIELWVITDNGAVKLNITGQIPLFFIASSQTKPMLTLLKQQGINVAVKILPLTNFNFEPISCLYFKTIKESRAAKAILRQGDIVTYEDDFTLDQRYLMERFIRGGIEFKGVRKNQLQPTQYDQVQVKTADFSPKLRALSIDIECSQHGELYSIGLHHQDYSKVIMIGEAQDSHHY